MKLIVTSFTYPPNKDGVSEATRTMAEGLASLGHEVVVATGDVAGSPKAEKLNGIAVNRFNLLNGLPRDRQSESEQSRFINLVSDFEPDVLINHCWDAWPAILSFRRMPNLKAKRIQVSHGFSSHLIHWHWRPPFGLGAWVRQLMMFVCRMPAMLKWYDAVVFLSDMKGFGRFFDHTLACWASHPNVFMIPNSVEVDSFPTDGQPFRLKHEVGAGTMILCVANYSERKNQELAVRAFRKANIPDSTLIFIGSEFNDYSRRVQQLDLSLRDSHGECRVIFLQDLTRAETLMAISACDIFLLTAKAETQPIVLIEAMAAGKPWISTPTGCVPTMEGGIISNGVNGISSAIKRIVDSNEFAEMLATEGRSAAEGIYSSEIILDRWETLLQTLSSTASQ